MKLAKANLTGKLRLEHLAQRSFVALEASGTGKRWTKDVLRVGSWVHPDTGKVLDFDREDLVAIARDSNRWNELGHRTYLPDGHTDSALANKGYAPRFWVEGDELLAEINVEDATTAGKIGTTIRDVSPLLSFDAHASNGEVFGAVIEHVALTPSPVIPGQGNFIPFARSAGKTKEQDMADNADDNGKKGATVSPKDAAKILAAHWGLPLDSDWDVIVKAILADEDEEEKSGEGAPGYMSSPAYMAREKRAKKHAEKLARETIKGSDEKTLALSRQLEQIQKERVAEKTKRDESEIALARKASAEAGLPLAKERCELATKLFARGEDEAARELLSSHVAHAKDRVALSRGRVQLATALTTPETEAETRDDAAERFLLEGTGASFEVDEKGRVKLATVKPRESAPPPGAAPRGR